MSSDLLRVLGISGSLRKASYNTSLLRNAMRIAGEKKLPIVVTIAEIRDLPLYDDDVRMAGYPEPVQRLRDAIAAADALLIATPEYNYSVPGVLKNAIDWASRPPSQPLAGKPFAVMGASSGLGGTVRAQAHLRQIAATLDMQPVNKPELFIRNAKSAFDVDGTLVDETAQKIVEQLLAALIDWTRRLKRS